MPILLFIIVTVTGYVPSAGGINCDTDCSITASGLPPGPGIAACGYGWKMGQLLYVPSYGLVKCGDRFGAQVGPYDIDLWFPDRELAYQWGRQRTAIIPVHIPPEGYRWPAAWRM